MEARDATGNVAPRGSDSRCKRAYHAVPEVANVRHGPSCSDAAKNAGQCKRPRPCKLCSKPKKKKGGGRKALRWSINVTCWSVPILLIHARTHSLTPPSPFLLFLSFILTRGS